MLLTALFGAILAALAFGLRRPFQPRRVAIASALGFALGLVAAYFNIYPGSIRGALGLLALALIVGGVQVTTPRSVTWTRPLIPRQPLWGGLLALALLLLALFPYTSWGAHSVDEPLYTDLNVNKDESDAPALPASEATTGVRVIPWDVASRILKLGYGADASFLDTDSFLVQRNTYPDTVRGEFVWVHAPAPQMAKWLFGGIKADKVLYVRNDASNLTPAVVPGTLNVHMDGVFWQDRIARHAQENGEFRYVLQDVALQLDDDYNPHWVAYLARVDLRDQRHLEKLVIVNAHTGAESVVSPKDAPAWMEMVYPETYVYEWAHYWGLHREGFLYRWFNAAQLMEPDDVTVRYIRLEDQTYWLLPMRQLQSNQLGGYILVNTRTGSATFYDRFDDTLIDYETAFNQLQAILASGEASGGGAIRLSVSEGYLYPIRMADGTVRDAYVFPLLEGLKVSRFAVIDAQDYNSKRVVSAGADIGQALHQFAALTGNAVAPPPVLEPSPAQTMTLEEGTVEGGRALVVLNGTLWRVTQDDLAGGDRREAQREFDELTHAIARVTRGGNVTLEVRIVEGRVVDVTLPGVVWGGG